MSCHGQHLLNLVLFELCGEKSNQNREEVTRLCCCCRSLTGRKRQLIINWTFMMVAALIPSNIYMWCESRCQMCNTCDWVLIECLVLADWVWHIVIITEEMQMPLSVSYSSLLLFSFKWTLQQTASNLGLRSNIYPCRIQLLSTLFFFLPFSLILIYLEPWNRFYHFS